MAGRLAEVALILGASPSGKAQGFDPCIPRFESWRPSHMPKLVCRGPAVTLMWTLPVVFGLCQRLGVAIKGRLFRDAGQQESK